MLEFYSFDTSEKNATVSTSTFLKDDLSTPEFPPVLAEKGVKFTNNSDDTSDSQKKFDKVLVLAAGRGTTGTHLMLQTTCHMGIPSQHWNLGCIPFDDSLEIHKNAFKKHNRLQSSLYGMERCISEQGDPRFKPKKACGSALKWTKQILELCQNITLDGGILALHDNPYPFLMSTFYKLGKKYYKDVVVISSERDPETYAKRRTKRSHRDLLCIDRTLKINNDTLEGGGFDVLGCVTNALRKVSLNERHNIDLIDVFTTIGQVGNATHGWQILADEMRDYQTAVRSVALFSFDMFQRKGKTAKESLAEEITDKIPSLKTYPRPKMQMVNWWKMEKLADDHPQVLGR